MDGINIKLLVVGGTGYIGKNICKKAVSIGWEVDSLSYNKINEHQDKISGVNYITGDLISDPLGCKKKLSHYDYIVNASGYVDHTKFFKGGKKNISSHFESILNLIRIIKKDKLKMFVQIGSSDEYGNGKAPQSENLRENPISPYSLGKVATTHFLQMLSKTEKFPTVILRIFLAYGPGQSEKRFLPQIINGCKYDLSFPTSEGMQLRDFCYIDDIIDAMFLTFEAKNISGEIINIASGKPILVKEIVELIKGLIGKGKPQYGKYPYRPGENMELYADLRKSKELLNWEPKTTLEEGLRKTIDWYLKDDKIVS